MSNQGSDNTSSENITDEQNAPEEAADSASVQSGEEQGMTLEELLAKLDAAEQESARAKDDLLRVQAEMQNLRRRSEQDVEKAHKYGQEKFAAELLTVVDNLERALEATKDSDNEQVRAIYDGVELTLKSFVDLFGKFNILAIDPLGEPFDPLRHQAVTMQENGEVEPNSVIAVMQKGYSLHDRVLRPAMVMVAKAPATS